jgi:hypothetical protein
MAFFPCGTLGEIFTIETMHRSRGFSKLCQNRQRKQPRDVVRGEMQAQDCTKFWRPPVDGLHLIENRQVAGSNFMLTAKIKGVKPYSFFDSF